MGELKCKTYLKKSPSGLIRVLFISCAEDRELYYDTITDKILDIQKNIAIYSSEDLADYTDDVIRSMNLVIAPITSLFLSPACRERIDVFQKAIDMNVPILPFQMEKGIAGLFNDICGKVQILDFTKSNDTKLDQNVKLKHFLDEALLDEDTIKKIRDSFDAYIFLSYRKKDRKQANEVMRLIHENEFMRDVAIWYDEYLVPGEQYSEGIEAAMAKSKLVALLVTPNLVDEDNYIQRVEYPMAVEKGKKVLPLEAVETDRAKLKDKFDRISDPVSDAEELQKYLEKEFASSKETEAPRTEEELRHLFFIGLAYVMGIDVEVDTDKGIELILKAFIPDKNDPVGVEGLDEAGKFLVDCMSHGRYIQPDAKSALYLQEIRLVRLFKHEDDFVRTDYLNYADIQRVRAELEVAVNGYTKFALSGKKDQIWALDKIVNECGDKTDDDYAALMTAKRELIHMMRFNPMCDIGVDIVSMVRDVWLYYDEMTDTTGVWDRRYDLAELMYDAVKAGPKIKGRHPMIDLAEKRIGGFLLDIKDGKKNVTDEELDEWLVTMANYMLNRLDLLNEEFEEDQDQKIYLELFGPGDDLLAFGKRLMGNTKNAAKHLLDSGDEPARDKLVQKYYSAFGTMLMNLEVYDQAEKLFTEAIGDLNKKTLNLFPDNETDVSEHTGYATDSIYLQIDNIENLMVLATKKTDIELMAMGIIRICNLYGDLCRITGNKEYDEKRLWYVDLLDKNDDLKKQVDIIMKTKEENGI